MKAPSEISAKERFWEAVLGLGIMILLSGLIGALIGLGAGR